MTNRIYRNWKKWQRIRETILNRDGYRCQSCKITLEELKEKYGRTTQLLIVHHIEVLVRNKETGKLVRVENNDLDNLTTLCYTCHYRAGWEEFTG